MVLQGGDNRTSPTLSKMEAQALQSVHIVVDVALVIGGTGAACKYLEVLICSHSVRVATVAHDCQSAL